jgi:uncharacterized SAM-binding protein YcdF (DUF218 family)
MFFYLSKLLVFIISPLTWIFTLLFFALFLKNPKHKKKLLIASIIVFYFFSNSFVLDECMRLWEFTSKDLSNNEHYDAAIVLGGMSSYDPRLDKPQFSNSADRLWQTLPLLKNGQVKKIILTGGSGSILHPDEKESGILKKYLLKIGIPDSLIIIENESKNTRENALFTKKLLDSLNLKSNFLFVTSAFHMKRSIRTFEKVGLKNIRPFCTDRYSGPRKFEFDHLFIPNTHALDKFTLLIHEIIGYGVYKTIGYI